MECCSLGNGVLQNGGIHELSKNAPGLLTGILHEDALHLAQDLGAMGLVLGGAFVWVKVFGHLTKQNLIERVSARA